MGANARLEWVVHCGKAEMMNTHTPSHFGQRLRPHIVAILRPVSGGISSMEGLALRGAPIVHAMSLLGAALGLQCMKSAPCGAVMRVPWACW